MTGISAFMILLKRSGPKLWIVCLVSGVSWKKLSIISAQLSSILSTLYLFIHDTFMALVKLSRRIKPKPPCEVGVYILYVYIFYIYILYILYKVFVYPVFIVAFYSHYKVVY